MSDPYGDIAAPLDPYAGIAAPLNKKEVQAPVDFSLKETLSNVPSSAAENLDLLWQMVRHPIQTGKAFGSLAGAAGNKIARSAAEQDAGHDIEPMEGHSEAAADAVVDFYKDRYGSVDGFQRALMDDPVGVLLDFAGVGAATKVPKLANLSRSAGPAGIAATAAEKAAKTVIPKRIPRSMYERSSKMAPRALDRNQRKRMVETGLREQVLPTSKGVKRIQDRIDDLVGQLTDHIDGAVKAGKEIDVNDIMRGIPELRRELGYANIDEAAEITKLDRFVDEFYKRRWESGRMKMTPREAQDFKVKLHEKINWKKAQQRGSQVKEQFRWTMTRGARQSIEDIVPEVKGINAQLGDLYELAPELGKVANRLDNNNIISLQDAINVIAGGTAGGPGGAVAATGLSVVRGPKFQARIALALEKMRTKDVSWLRQNAGAPEVAYALVLAGRANETVSLDDRSATQ